jgi:OmpA-OmpF porin, OOP family
VQNSYLGSLPTAFPGPAVQSIANHFGTSEKTILDGVQSSIAAVVNGLAQRSKDKGFVSQILQLASSTPENAAASALSNGSLTNPASTFLTGSSQFLSSVFGGRLGALTDALNSQTGLRSTAVSALLALGGQSVLGFLGGKVRDGSVSASSLPQFLADESDALQGMLPREFQKKPAAATTHKVDVNPVIAQSVQRVRHRSILPWVLGLLLAALVVGVLLYRSNQRPVAMTRPEMAAPAVASHVSGLGGPVDVALPDATTLHIPERGVENRLLVFVKDPAHTPDTTSWFDFDRVLFETDSASLQPQSAEQLGNVAAILKAYPAVHLLIGGYTDNTGDPEHNLKLSQDRADSVVERLGSMGIAAERLQAKGYGDEHPVSDNATEAGRALNRRISMLVTDK